MIELTPQGFTAIHKGCTDWCADRATLLVKPPPRRTIPRLLWWPEGGRAVSYEQGTPVSLMFSPIQSRLTEFGVLSLLPQADLCLGLNVLVNARVALASRLTRGVCEDRIGTSPPRERA